MLTLRPYQEDGVRDIRAAFAAGHRAVVFVSPTGSGKTVVMTYVAHGATRKGNRMLILVHRQELIRQTANALAAMEVVHGYVTPDHAPEPWHPVQLAMVQTFANRPDCIPPNLIMVDECHHGLAATYREILNRYPAARILGLTATPERLDGRGLGALFDVIVEGPTVQSLIGAGYLCRPRYFAPPTPLDMTGVRRCAGDFNRAQTAERVDRPTITGCAVTHYQRICPGVPAVAFCVSVRHAEHVRDQFIAAGIPAASIDGTLSDDDRIDRVDRLTDGRINVLTSVDVISEGFDLPAVTAAILLRPTESLAMALQQFGRVLRPAPGKDHAIILDHVGNCMRHGLAEEARAWSLGGRPKAAKYAGTQLRLYTCQKCHAVHPPAPACPVCGAVYPVKDRAVAQIDGTLEALTAAAILAERDRIAKRRAVGTAKTRTELEAIARQRGYSPKWVLAMLAARARKSNRSRIDDHLAATAQGSLPI